MDTGALLVTAIVKQQKAIMGPMAVDLANKVAGIHVTSDGSSAEVKGDTSQVLTNLVKQYERLFGKASVEACKEAVKEKAGNTSTKDLPAILQ